MYIKFIIILIIVFLAIYYVITFIKIKNKRNNHHNNLDIKSDICLKFDDKDNLDENMIRFDYIDREELHKIIQDELHSEDEVKSKKILRKIEF